MTSTTNMDHMARYPPEDLLDLQNASTSPDKTFCCVMGVVSTVWEAKTVRNSSSWQIMFNMRDASSQGNGLRVKYFTSQAAHLPNVEVGDVILLRDLKIVEYRGATSGLSNYQTKFFLFPKLSIPVPHFRHQYAVNNSYLPHSTDSNRTPSIHDQQWAITLKSLVRLDDMRPIAPTDPIASENRIRKVQPQTLTSPSSSHQVSMPGKFSTLAGVKLDKFYDLLVEVVRKSVDPYGVLALYITDYTEHPQFEKREKASHVYGETEVWPGPYGRMTLRIEVMTPHSHWIKANVRDKDIVILKNVRIKAGRDYDTLEGNMWTDHSWPNKVNVERATTSSYGYSWLKERQRTYKNALGSKVEDTGETRSRKRSKRNRREIAQGKKHDVSMQRPLKRSIEETSENTNPEGAKKPRTSKAVADSIICKYPDVPLSTFSTVVHNPLRSNTTPTSRTPYILPFINVNHRVHLRCTDFYPHDLRAFTRATTPCAHTWEWHFYLVVVAGDPADPEPRPIHVQVAGADAEHLVGMPPCDLAADAGALARLRDAMFLLWGDLEERKSAFLAAHPLALGTGDGDDEDDAEWSCLRAGIVPDNRAFEACVGEFGVPVGRRGAEGDEMDVDGAGEEWEGGGEGMGWVRMWKLFGTKIAVAD